jgi:hypothetical protein
MKHIVVDIETLGRTPGSVILSVGAVASTAGGAYEKLMRSHFYRAIDVADSLGFGFTTEDETMAWWRTQSGGAFRAALAGGETAEGAMQQLNAFINKVRGDQRMKLRVWANGSNFDIPMLEAYMRRFGFTPAWRYNEVRDLRTLGDFLSMDRHVIEHPSDHIAHHALDDAVSQMNALQAMLKRGAKT